jgi:hypothetical protein
VASVKKNYWGLPWWDVAYVEHGHIVTVPAVVEQTLDSENRGT